ncbi:MAG: lysylphosphatidylglycerol synthase transmembrane domain-containing protein [Chloroflexota bacterium]
MSRRARTALRWGLGLGLLVVVVAWFDVASVGDRLSSVNLALAVPAMVGLVAVHLVAALSWQRLTARLAGVRLDARSTIRLYYAAQALGAVTPANLGADVFRVAAIDSGSGRARLARPVLVQRLTSIVALVIVGAAGLVALPIEGRGPLLVAVALVALAAVAAIAVLSTRAAPPAGAAPRAGAALRAGASPRAGAALRFARWLGPIFDAGQGGNQRVSVLRDGVGLGLAFHVISLLLGLVLVAAVHAPSAARPVEVLAALAVARLSLAVPLSPNGIGIQEGALSVLFATLGLPPDVALAAALLNRMALVATAVLGSVLLIVGARTGMNARRTTLSGHADG